MRCQKFEIRDKRTEVGGTTKDDGRGRMDERAKDQRSEVGEQEIRR